MTNPHLSNWMLSHCEDIKEHLDQMQAELSRWPDLIPDTTLDDPANTVKVTLLRMQRQLKVLRRAVKKL